MENLIIIGAIIFIIIVYFVVRYVINVAFTKGAEAIQDARARAHNGNVPSGQVSLSDRFGNDQKNNQ